MVDPLAYPFMVHALTGGTAAAAAAAPVGWFMVLRRQAFAGHTLSALAFPGAAGALLAGLPAALGYFIFATAGALGIALLPGHAEGRGESVLIATVQTLGLGLGLLFLSLYGGLLGDYESLLFGDFLGITGAQALTLAAVAGGSIGLLLLGGRPLLFASVDRPVARASGVPVRALGAGFLCLLGLTIAAVAQITGALLVFALLVAPPAAAQQLTSRILPSVGLAIVIALLVTWSGLLIAFFTELPAGFTITALAVGAYLSARWTAGRRA